MKILIVDDEMNIRLLLKEILMMNNVDSDEAEHGKMGLEKVMQQHYDMIFLDRRMPIMSGDETLVEMRKHTDVPIYLISAFQTDEQIAELKQNGATGILMKPFTIEEVTNIVQNYTK
ncbi:response regulator [Macrococcus armenti]|uniref:Response regulator n=1 Tax=Macrococcus armenti TaxID=2875764 RepID=A0ABY3ZTT1_9STAP|nr:response regulator [Macrococcus armenti]UBH08413.1 response regulator [Macrococcus armenti]UBH10699.1 response regulator [Macrococcus armenti]UBH15181.1 response regulator [Macrococcus armenti]UBH17541.1 response regulator [Macrococcus armenti]UBH19807.1 response regulator [Macrococcus armenti]